MKFLKINKYLQMNYIFQTDLEIIKTLHKRLSFIYIKLNI